MKTVSGYTGSNGAWTTDSNGFAFIGQRAPASSMYATYYDKHYCAALGGYYTYSTSAQSLNQTLYKTSGDYYNASGAKIGSVSTGTKTYYTITTSAGSGGSMSGGGDYESGATATVTATPNTGYVCTSFNGTSYTDDSTGAKSTTFAVSADATISATFAKFYKIKFWKNTTSSDTTATTKSPFVYGKSYNLTSLATLGWARTGYRFLGWATSRDGAVAYTDAQQISNLSSTANGTVNLYARWVQYTLTYAANGGSSTPSPQTYFGNITLASAISRAGYAFVGWKIGSTTYNAGATYNLAATATATAQWTAFTVTYNANGGSVSPSSGSGVVTLPTPTRTGYTFGGWYTAASGGTKVGNGGASYTPTASITIYAHWTLNKYTLTLTKNANISSITVTYTSGGTSKTETKTANATVQADYGSTWYAYATPAAGYSTTYYDASHRTSGTMGTGGATFSPTASLNKYTLTLTKNANISELYYKVNGASSWTKATASTTVQANYGLTWYAYAVAATGYSTATSSTSPQSGTMGTSGATFAPTATAKTYTLTFNPNGGKYDGGTAAYTVPNTTDTAKPTFGSRNYWAVGAINNKTTRTGYTLLGWYTAASGGEMVYDSGGHAVASVLWNGSGSAATWKYDGNITVYAHWQAISSTVTLDGQSPTTAGTASVAATYGSAMPGIPTLPQKTGHTFGGFYTAKNGGGTQYYDASGASAKNWDKTSDTTLYAKWTANAYTVKFNANGGSGTMANQSFSYGTAQNLSANAFTRTGYRFGGWATSASGTAVYSDKQSVSNLATAAGATVNLYAKWQGNRCYIDFDLNGGGTRESQTTYQNEAAAISAPTRTNYRFTGWAVAGYGSTAKWGATNNPTTAISGTISTTGTIYVLNLNTTDNSRVTMKAQWERVTSTVTVNNAAGTSYSLLVNGAEGDVSKTIAAGSSGSFTARAGAKYTVTATMASATFTNSIAYPLTIAGKAFARTANASPAKFAATSDAIPDGGAAITWTSASRTVTTSTGANPLSETLNRQLSFADATSTNVRVVAPETVGSDFLNWTAISPNTALAQGYSATDADVVVRTGELSQNVTMTANWQLSRVNVSAQVHSASLAVLPAASGWVAVSDSSNTAASSVGYGQTATWKFAVPSGSSMPDGYAFAGWYDEAGNLVSVATSYSKKITVPTVLYAKLSSRLRVEWDADSGDTQLLGDAGYVVVDGVTVTTQSGYSKMFVIGGTVIIEAQANAAEGMYFAGWYSGTSGARGQRQMFTARQEITIGAKADYCAFFRNEAELFSVAVYSRNAATGEYDNGISFTYGGDAATITPFSSRSAYANETGQPLLDEDAAQSSAIFLQVEGAQRIVIEAGD